MKKKQRKGQIILNIVFILLAICYIYPFLMVVSVSLTEETALYQNGYQLIPEKISTLAYEMVFRNPEQMIRAYAVTIVFTLAATLLSALVTALLAYPLSRPNFLWKKPLSFLVFFTMLFSGGLVPTYLLLTKYLHLNDTIWVYILPGLVSAYNVMIVRTNYRSLPNEMIEAAKLDGASELRICFQIVIPLCRAGIASVAFLFLVAKWNDWMTSMLYIRNPNLYSLQYLLQRLLRETDFLRNSLNGLDAGTTPPLETMRFAMALVAAGPVLVIFPFFQKYFTKGMTLGGVKG